MTPGAKGSGVLPGGCCPIYEELARKVRSKWGGFPATQGELLRDGRNRFNASWMSISWVDPTYDFDGDPYFGPAGCGSGWDLMALAIWGPLTMPTCDTWAASFDLEFIVYDLGTDPFADGCSMGNPFGTGEGFCQRLPRLE
jgi:hypothetical protein